jgi:hypothetical protein
VGAMAFNNNYRSNSPGQPNHPGQCDDETVTYSLTGAKPRRTAQRFRAKCAVTRARSSQTCSGATIVDGIRKSPSQNCGCVLGGWPLLRAA